MRVEGLKNKQKTRDNREASNTQSGLDTIAKNILREKKKKEKEERDQIEKIEHEHNKAISDGKRATKEASKANNAKLRLARKAIKKN